MKICGQQPTDSHLYADIPVPLRGKRCVQKSKSIEKVVTCRRLLGLQELFCGIWLWQGHGHSLEKPLQGEPLLCVRAAVGAFPPL